MALDLLKQITMTKGKAKSLFHNIWLHDYAERLRMRRASDASKKGFGLDDSWDVGTYPQETIQVESSQQRGASWVPAGLAALLGAAATGGALYFGTAADTVINPVEKTIELQYRFDEASNSLVFEPVEE